jgi:hypothetical protein
MERHIELQVRYASASMDGETATIAVATDHGHLTLRMHRIVLGALAGTIARALFPKVGDSVPAPGAIEMQDSPTQPRSEEPEGDPADAVPEAEPQNVIIQSGPEETAESGAAVAGVEPENVPTQPEGDPAYRVPEAEPQKVMTQSGPEEPVAEYAAEPENVPTQREAEESEHELLSTFDALWPGMGGSAAPSSRGQPQDVPSQPEPREVEGEPAAAFTSAKRQNDRS